VAVVLGDMYLEVGDYHRAATTYIKYLTQVATSTTSAFIPNFWEDKDAVDKVDVQQVEYYHPQRTEMANWSSIFGRNATADIISYIPMAANGQYGVTTNVTLAFGGDYYATPDEQTGYTRRNSQNISGETRQWGYSLPLVTNVQIVPSDSLMTLSKARGALKEMSALEIANCRLWIRSVKAEFPKNPSRE
jgi:hypothetical protein